MDLYLEKEARKRSRIECTERSRIWERIHFVFPLSHTRLAAPALEFAGCRSDGREEGVDEGINNSHALIRSTGLI
jgi:hypothetical protein